MRQFTRRPIPTPWGNLTDTLRTPCLDGSYLNTPYAGLSTAVPLVLLPPLPPASTSSPALFLPPFVRCHVSNGLRALRLPSRSGNVSSTLTDIGSISSEIGVGWFGDTAAAFFLPPDLVARFDGGGVAGLKRSLIGVTLSGFVSAGDSTLGMSMSVTASSSTSSTPCSRSRIWSSEGKRRRGLIALLVRGRCADGPAWCFKRRC